MARNRGPGFWNSFFDDERSDDIEVIYGPVLPEFREFYYSIVSESPNYAEYNDIEKLFIAEEFMTYFYRGGYGAADQEEWIYLLGLRLSDFDWDEYASIYDSIQG